jgi:hypothetical protein
MALPFARVASMTTCCVLRCPETPASIFKLMPDSRLEVPVCARHKAALESGAHWMVHWGTGLPPANGANESTGISLLMGADFPDYDRLIGFGVSPTIGGERGFAVELNIDAADGQQRVSFWATKDVGRRLGAFLANPTEPTCSAGILAALSITGWSRPCPWS